MQITAEHIATIKAFTPQPGFRPAYDVSQGFTAWRFSDLCRQKGYATALWYAELIRDRVPDIPTNCTLLVSFAAFVAAEKELENETR